MQIKDKTIGNGAPCFIIAEAGVNHNGDVKAAERLVDVAAEAGADAVKFQMFKADLLAAPQAGKAEYQANATGAAESQVEMLRKLELPPEAFKDLQSRCADRGIIFISSVFDHESVEVLDRQNVPAFKIASGEATNLALVRHIAEKGRPIILSTGMCYLSDVESSVRAIQETGNRQLALLHCLTDYPASPAEVNLRAMETMARAFNLPVGFSDHTQGFEVSLAAVALGAAVIEKHFTLDHELAGPDHRASMEPGELEALVKGIRIVEQAFGDGVKRPMESELTTRTLVRKSIHMRRAVEAGAVLEADQLINLRPEGGIPVDQWDMVVGRRAKRALPAGAPVAWNDIE
jgi:N,N'-diacetyllegionaminate synthase